MNEQQLRTLSSMIFVPGTPTQLAYILSVALEELRTVMEKEPARIEHDYGTRLAHYIRNMTDE